MKRSRYLFPKFVNSTNRESHNLRMGDGAGRRKVGIGRCITYKNMKNLLGSKCLICKRVSDNKGHMYYGENEYEPRVLSPAKQSCKGDNKRDSFRHFYHTCIIPRKKKKLKVHSSNVNEFIKEEGMNKTNSGN